MLFVLTSGYTSLAVHKIEEMNSWITGRIVYVCEVERRSLHHRESKVLGLILPTGQGADLFALSSFWTLSAG